MLVAASSPPTLIPIRISGNRIGGIDHRRLAQRLQDRAPRHLVGLLRAASGRDLRVAGVRVVDVELAAGLGQEHVVQRRLVQLQVGHAQVGGVERAHDRDQVLAALAGARPPRPGGAGTTRAELR